MIDETIENQFMLMNFLIGLIFIIVISVILVSIIKGISEWNKNNNSPKLSVNAKVVTKRTSVQGGGETRAYNHYYVTFEVESGGRIELKVDNTDYGMLVEEDYGMLQLQGTRYLGFTRNRLKN